MRFDEPNLVSSAGLVPLMALAHKTGLPQLGDEHLSVPTDKGSNAGLKLASLVTGMTAGADSIDDMALLRHGAEQDHLDRLADYLSAQWPVEVNEDFVASMADGEEGR